MYMRNVYEAWLHLYVSVLHNTPCNDRKISQPENSYCRYTDFVCKLLDFYYQAILCRVVLYSIKNKFQLCGYRKLYTIWLQYLPFAL